MLTIRRLIALSALSVCMTFVGCTSVQRSAAPQVTMVAAEQAPSYQIGAGDNLRIFVWRNDDLSAEVPVRPDGRISIPLVADLKAAGKTPTEVAAEIEDKLRTYVKDPVVTVIVTSFVGPYSQQVRVIGEVAQPQAIAYRDNMSVLDAVIAVGGLSKLAAGNRAAIIRKNGDEDIRIPVQLADLMEDGDMATNRRLLPGDVIIVPQSWF